MVDIVTDLPPCSLVHSTDALYGWDIVDIFWSEDDSKEPPVTVKHVVPCNDTRKHTFCHSCWCDPIIDDEDSFMLVHRSHDGREAYEDGTSAPS